MEGPVKGEVMTYRGRPYVVVGMDPVGATPRLVYLEDTATSESQTVSADELDDTLSVGYGSSSAASSTGTSGAGAGDRAQRPMCAPAPTA